jgi:hypothetical protein
VAAGQNEPLERLDLLVKRVDPALEAGDVLVGDARADGLPLRDAVLDVGRGQFAADVEERRLDGREPASEVVVL